VVLADPSTRADFHRFIPGVVSGPEIGWRSRFLAQIILAFSSEEYKKKEVFFISLAREA